MQVTRVSLRNYRQYPKFELSLDGADVALLVARISAGKTNLLNAITWCLYGKELMFDGGDTGLDMRSVMPMDGAPTTVELRLRFDDGREALLLRELTDPMTHAALPNGTGRLSIQESRNPNEGFDPVADPDGWVQRYLPQRVQPYFLINAERVIQFSGDTGTLPVQKAVLQIAQIDTLERLVRHLESVRTDYLKDLQKLKTDTEIDSLAGEIASLDSRILSLRTEIAFHRDEMEVLDGQLAQNDDELDRLRESSEAIERFKSLDHRFKTLSHQHDELESKLTAQYALLAPLMFAGSAVELLNSAITDALNRNILPPPVSAEYLHGLLNDARCVCGTDLSADSHHRQVVLAAIAVLEGTSVRGLRLNELRAPLGLLERTRSDATVAVDDLKGQLKAILMETQSVERELLHAREDVAGIKEENVRELLAARRRAEEARRECQRHADQKSYQLDQAVKTRDARQADLQRRLKQQKSGKGLVSTLEFVNECVSIAQRAYEEIALETRQAVSAKLRQLFFEMHWDAAKYSDVHIDDNYAIHVIDSSGGCEREALGAISDGERVILAIAFSQALSEVSGFELPMVFDSPLVKLDRDSKVLVAASLAKHVTNRQLVLLMKPGEYDETIEKALESRQPVEWSLVPETSTRSTAATRKG